MTTSQDGPGGRPQVPPLAGTAEAAAILQVRNQQVARLAAHHADFPKPVEQLAATPVYLRDEIVEWGRRWDRKRTGRPRKQGPEVPKE